MTEEQEKVLYFCNIPYQMCHFSAFDYEILSKCPIDQARGKHKEQINECFIMWDTETSKSKFDEWKIVKQGKREKREYLLNENYVVAWTLAINIYGYNIVCLYGHKPSELVQVIEKIADTLPGTKTVFYCHNLGYDHQFCRRFFYRQFGYPVEQLNTKPHYPVNLHYKGGIHIRDSLILSQRSIEKWADDLQVIHRKAVGSWNYDRIRHQNGSFTKDELLYIQNDVLAGVECLNAMRKTLHKTYAGMPYTQTGIVRAEAKQKGQKHQAHKDAEKCYNDLSFYDLQEEIYHGGYTHANRHYTGFVNEGNIKCYDFASSYPFCALTERMPVEAFNELDDTLTDEQILNSDLAFIFRFRACGIRLRNSSDPFPVLQVSKVRKVINGIFDNGRILQADFVDIYVNEIDYALIHKKYVWDQSWNTDIWFAEKDFLPEWLRDYIFELFCNKTQLKGGDPVLYAIAKGMLNSVYG